MSLINEKRVWETWREKRCAIGRLSVFLPSAAQDEVAAGDEGQGDEAGAQGRTCAGQCPAALATDRLTATGAASLRGGRARPARGSGQTTNADRRRGTVSAPISG